MGRGWWGSKGRWVGVVGVQGWIGRGWSRGGCVGGGVGPRVGG